MSYIEDVERELRQFLEKLETARGLHTDTSGPTEEIITLARQKLAQSFHNGMAAAEKARPGRRRRRKGRAV